MSGRLVFAGARVVDPASGTDEVRDVVVADGVVAGSEAAEGAERVEARGLVLAPGLVDLHTHLREPGDEHKETVQTGTRAAAAGGYTAIAAMANTDPVTDHAAIVHEVRDLARAAGLCDVFPVGAITKGLEGESLAEMGEMVEAGVRMFSDDGRCVPSARLLRNALLLREGVPRGDRPGRARGGARRSSRAARCTRGCTRRRSALRGGRPKPRRSSWRATSPSPPRRAAGCTCATSPRPGPSS